MNIYEIEKAIDNMEIYEKDYDTIQLLINNTDISFFTKVLEEVLLGNLYWSDFETILANNEYQELLKNTLETQSKLNEEINRLIEFRRNTDRPFDPKSTLLGIIETDDKNQKKLYEEEYENLRKNFIYEMLSYNQNDTIIARACKNRIANAINNGELFLKSIIDNNEIKIGDTVIGKIENNEIFAKKDNENYEKIEVLNPNDILFSADKFIIPISEKYQYLDKTDNEFMKNYSVSEDMMKKIKASALLLRRYNVFSE